VEVCRKLGVSEQTFYRWKRQFAGMGVVELRRLRQVEDENRKLKQLVADLSLDKHMLQEALRKKLVKPPLKRAVVRYFRVGFRVSERRACRLAGVGRSSFCYRSQASDQTALRLRLRDLAATRVRYGYRRLHVLLRREGCRVNHKRVYRLYREEGLGIRVKRRKKLANAPRVVPPPPTRPPERWSLDFLSDSLADGRRFRVLTIVDNVSRVSPAIEVGVSLTGDRVVRLLEGLRATAGTPQRIAIDNGPECVSKALDAWAYQHGVQLEFSRPGKPTDNAFAESFNGHFRAECLDCHWFVSLEEACHTIEAWRIDDHAERPHRALGQETPTAWMGARERLWEASG
jgi:putative transposase